MQPSSGARCLNVGRTLRVLPYFMCANSEGSGETARMCRLAWAFAGSLCDKYHILMSWLIWATSWENLLMPYANNKDADQPAHPRRLISTFVIRCLDSIIPLFSVSEISSLYLASVAAQAGLNLTWSETPKKGFLVTRLICSFMFYYSSS